MREIKIIIVDDQRLFASSIKIIIDGYADRGLRVVGIASNGQECLGLLEKALPDIILMDVRMPVMDGVQATKIIHETYPDIKIMMLTTFDDDTYVSSALSNGAMGYVLKNVEPHELISCIEAVSNGNLLVSASVGSRFFHHSIEEPGEASNNPLMQKEVEGLRERFPQLTGREIEVLRLVLQGMDNYHISQLLFIAEQTVRNYTSIIYSKIGVDDRLHAIRLLGPMS